MFPYHVLDENVRTVHIPAHRHCKKVETENASCIVWSSAVVKTMWLNNAIKPVKLIYSACIQPDGGGMAAGN